MYAAWRLLNNRLKKQQQQNKYRRQIELVLMVAYRTNVVIVTNMVINCGQFFKSPDMTRNKSYDKWISMPAGSQSQFFFLVISAKDNAYNRDLFFFSKIQN